MAGVAIPLYDWPDIFEVSNCTCITQRFLSRQNQWIMSAGYQ